MTGEIESAWPRYPDYAIETFRCFATGQVWAGDVLVAESADCLVLTETDHVDRLYFPVEDVCWEMFEATDLHTICPFKGQADYWSLAATDPVEENVVWAYPRPFSEVAAIEGYVCFYHERLRVVLNESWPDGSIVTTRFPKWGDASELLALMDVEQVGERRFVAPAFGRTDRNVVESGQLLGGAIVAASKALPGYGVTSASMVFSKAAAFDAPIDLDVQILRGGKTFSTVEVRASQDGSLRSTGLLLMDSGAGDLIQHRVPMPDVPGPADSVPHDFGLSGRDLRVVEGAYNPDPDLVGPPELNVWVRFRDAPAEQYLHAALLTQSTGHWTVAAAMRPHRGYGEANAHKTLSTGVMQTTVAFHDEVDVSEWLLYANPAIYAGRGLAQGEGRVFTQDGRLVASYSVQVLLRAFERDPTSTGHDSGTAM
jgi:acyl-CoA thioesterase-2